MNVATELNPDARTTGRGLVWAFVPVALLAASLIGVGTMSSIAARDPAFALETNYYDRAVHWDAQQAQWAENARLGYQVEVTSTPVAGGSELVVHVLDRQRQPLHSAVVRAEAFANARAAERTNLMFTERPDGAYAATLARARPGVWELRFQVEHAGEHFTANMRTELAPSSRP